MSTPKIDVSLLTNNTVVLLYLERESIFPSPDYQRDSGIWDTDKKQLLIDSIINEFDIPKIYLHVFDHPVKFSGKSYRYALVDGKQRLEAIWEFMSNDFPLSDDMIYLREPKLKLAGLTYKEIGEKYPKIAAYFDGRPLSIMGIRTSEVELIEEMFSRLNEAVPLNAPEKRNAFGGALPPIIRRLSKQPFFLKCLPFSNTRYRHFDIACKLLYLQDIKGFEDTKKVKLDEFVKHFKKKTLASKAKDLETEVIKVLNLMHVVFTAKDKLLRNVGILPVIYMLFYNANKDNKLKLLKRAGFSKFESIRAKNRKIAEDNIEKADYDLIKFEELSNYVNDNSAMIHKYNTFVKYVFNGLKPI